MTARKPARRPHERTLLVQGIDAARSALVTAGDAEGVARIDDWRAALGRQPDPAPLRAILRYAEARVLGLRLRAQTAEDRAARAGEALECLAAGAAEAEAIGGTVLPISRAALAAIEEEDR